MNNQEQYMRRCLQLAALGRGFTAPNPMVGAVIVWQDIIIGEGFHRRYGEPHAEVNAIADVCSENLLKESTLYVNLEPCSHHGKTPPCAELIIKKHIPRVVVGHIDPCPKVSGQGLKMLQEAGVEVVCGVLEEECKAMNCRFLTYIEKRRPYIILKWAQTADGFIDKIRETGDKQRPVRISNELTKIIVHKHRSEESAIMVGKRTKLLDNPRLDVRYWAGNNPVKFVADSSRTLYEQLHDMYAQGLQSLIVEGGARLLNSFINQHLWDEADIEVANFQLSNGVKAPKIDGILTDIHNYGNSNVFRYSAR
ncbi:MAG: bifunctional diaminohydroxyphosphoribosylaminopyrimidine deaminase/5-amino-6-(5-phosphoribosylamino)uracil reductase RibD [Dysgonamonadaceae bacterium]|jgi:diaminohydroxyphosphoribosylaminopyrimidine deaminase/5-amino-6-(5-phosphoribosylamino)uracil reductase|nr:bifunctional diaminohydroxyphosphoribosylaminopyrimidine deaminase/5-amino-6-(5-phosphoribosylamino)uracil reductase RibD [Dysgonamonadaceae bacterium]